MKATIKRWLPNQMNNTITFPKQPLKYDVVANDDLKPILNKIEQNFSEGEKSVAFGSTHYKNSQEKCILLAAHLFNTKFPSLKILIVTFNVKGGVFSDFLQESFYKDGFFNFASNLAFADWEKILRESYDIQDLIDSYDLVFWDLPDIKTITARHLELQNCFSKMDGLYLISFKSNNFDEENFKREIMHYFKDHGLDIRTVLPWQFGAKKRKPRSSLSRLFYGLFRR